jgi:tetratricopeptide (TPR) repeat protein
MKLLLAVCSIVALILSLGVAHGVKSLPKDPVERAKALERYKQGLALYAKGQKLHREKKFDEANATYGEAMELFQDGPKPDMANCYNSLGNAYLSEKPHVALWYYAKGLSVRLDDHGQEHETVATSYNHVGMACMKMKEYDRAVTYFKGSMGIFKRLNPRSNNPHLAASHSFIGSAHAGKKDHAEAIHHYEKALEAFIRSFGQKHPNVARAKRDLGFAMIEKGGQKQEAKALLLEAKNLFDATMGPGYVETKELVEKMKKLK